MISGAASGIGRATTLAFAAAGAAVALADIDQERGIDAARAVALNGGRALWLHCDVTSEVACRQAIERAVVELGGLEILVNSAGIIRRASVTETSEEEWDRVMAVNVKSVFLLSRLAIPHLGRAGGGVIINISSGWGLVGGRRAASYCASKAAVVNLTRAMALDHAAQNIRVVCLCPGDTDTPMLRSEADQLGEPVEDFLRQAAERPLGRIGRPEEIANAAVFLASDRASFVTGSALLVDGGGLAG